MKRLFKKVKNDNKGITLLLAVVAVAFVGILAASIVSATTTNYKLKMMDKYSKETFYNADSIVEEIRTGIGIKCFDVLSDAYNYTASNLLLRSPQIDGSISIVQKNNDQANTTMKLTYMSLMGKAIFGDVLTNEEKIMNFLNSFITDPNNARVASFSSMTEKDDNDGYLIQDVVIEYKKNSDTPYYSTVAIDIDIKYPDIYIDFISDKKELKTYLNYCLIAMDEISVGETYGSGAATVSGGMYAGDGGVDIFPGSSLYLTDDIMVGNQTKVKTRLVTNENIDLLAGNNAALLQVDGADIWCKNINVGKETSPGKILYNSLKARTFVADDLSLEGTGSEVTLKGMYLGFGSNNSYSSTSSAIIVNGRNCTLDMSDINTLLLAGKAYVDLGDDEYKTGDSIGLKGNQEIYLVPMEFVYKKYGTSNPLNVSNPTKHPEDVAVDLDGFFAEELGLLSERGYVEKTSAGKTYYYLEFDSEEAQNNYVRCIIEDGYLAGMFTNAHISFDTQYNTQRNSILSTVEMGVARFFDKNTDIKISSSAKINTKGTLVEVTKGTDLPKVNIHNSDANGNIPNVVGMSTSTANKYEIIKAYLDVEEDANYASFPSKIVIDGGTYEVDRNNLPNIYDLIVNKTELDVLTENIIHIDSGTIAAVITSNATGSITEYDVPNGVVNGVILAYGVDINLNHNFEGLIITDGKIKVVGNSNITTGKDNRAELTLDVYNDVAKYFNIFDDTSDTRQIEELDIEDVLEFSNWRKNENV